MGQLGLILESREKVMRVCLKNYRTGRFLPIQPQLYLRGATLTHYDCGQWTNPAAGKPPPDSSPELFDPRDDSSDDPSDEDQAEPRGTVPFSGRRFAPLPENRDSPPQWVRQQITVEPLDRDELFCIWPWSLVPDGHESKELYYDQAQGRLKRRGPLRERQFAYQLITTAFADGRLQSLLPCNDPGFGLADNDRPADPRRLLQVPRVPRLVALAQKWVAASGLRRDNRLGVARLLEQQLGRAGQFQYSLEGQNRDPKIDPIEDFVTNNPRGHCEYFAAALALMLRSQGIPARVVLGYRCDEWKSLGRFYQVRESDAHAWVEAYLAARDIPPDLRWGNEAGRWDGGAWLRLDATPSAAEITGHSAMDKARRGTQLDRFPLGRLRCGNGSKSPGRGRLSAAGSRHSSRRPQSV